MRSPVLFSYSDALFIPAIDESHQQAIRKAIEIHEGLEETKRVH